MAIDINGMKNEFETFFEKYEHCRFNGEHDEENYVSNADKLLEKYDMAESEEEKRALSEQCVHLGCKIMMYTDNESGPRYYHKAIELQPDCYDVRWDYYTTLEEIIEAYPIPELIHDAIDCLNFCINSLTTPELQQEKHIENRYCDLARVYMAAKDYAKAKECAEKSLEFKWDDFAQELLDEAEGMLSE